MTRPLNYTCAIVLFSWLIQSCATMGSKTDQTIREITAMEDNWMRSLSARDSAAISAILLPDFTLSGGSMARETRQQYLQTSAMPERYLEPITLEDRAFQIFPRTVISSGIATYKGKYKNHIFDLKVRYTNIYVKQRQWKVASAHLSTLD